MTDQDNEKPPQGQDAAPLERKQTALDAYTKESLTNPKFKMVKPSGTGFVIGGQKA